MAIFALEGFTKVIHKVQTQCVHAKYFMTCSYCNDKHNLLEKQKVISDTIMVATNSHLTGSSFTWMMNSAVGIKCDKSIQMQMLATNLVFISTGFHEYCVQPTLVGVLGERSTSNASFSSMAVNGCQSRVVFHLTTSTCQRTFLCAIHGYDSSLRLLENCMCNARLRLHADFMHHLSCGRNQSHNIFRAIFISFHKQSACVGNFAKHPISSTTK